MYQKKQTPTPTPLDQPVAYDVHGRPLYARPQPVVTPGHHLQQSGHAVEPKRHEVSPDTKAKHDDAVKKYPRLNLSKSEYVLEVIHRHPIGLLVPVSVAALLVALALVAIVGYPSFVEASPSNTMPPYGSVIGICLLFIILFSLGGYIAAKVYLGNRFILTNESVIQEIQTSLFARREQTVSLGSVEDVSYAQKGILQSILGYGMIRLSTEGDETTYRFHYVSNPRKQVAILNNAVEDFKNGRPVES